MLQLSFDVIGLFFMLHVKDKYGCFFNDSQANNAFKKNIYRPAFAKNLPKFVTVISTIKFLSNSF